MCLCLAIAAIVGLSAQADSVDIHMAILTSGGSERSVHGRYSYSIGQVAQEFVGGSFRMNQGIQQPREFLIVATKQVTPEMVACNVYPNPTNSELTIALSQEALTPFRTYRLTLSDQNGRILRSDIIDSPVTRIPVATYPSGMYVVRIIDNRDNYAVFKIIKI